MVNISAVDHGFWHQFGIFCFCNYIYLLFVWHIIPESIELYIKPQSYLNRIGGIIVMLASSVVDCEFEPRSGQTKDYKIGFCCFSAKQVVLRSKSKDWLTRNQNNVSEWSDISTHGLLFQWASTMKIQLNVLV